MMNVLVILAFDSQGHFNLIYASMCEMLRWWQYSEATAFYEPGIVNLTSKPHFWSLHGMLAKSHENDQV